VSAQCACCTRVVVCVLVCVLCVVRRLSSSTCVSGVSVCLCLCTAFGVHVDAVMPTTHHPCVPGLVFLFVSGLCGRGGVTNRYAPRQPQQMGYGRPAYPTRQPERDLAEVERQWGMRHRSQGARPTSSGMNPNAARAMPAYHDTFDTHMASVTAQRTQAATRDAVAQHADWLQKFRKQVSSQYRESSNRVTHGATSRSKRQGLGGVAAETNLSLAGILSPRHERYRSASPHHGAKALNFAAEV